MRKILFLIGVLGASCTAWAQSNPASWENLNTLQAGQKIQVLEISSTKVTGNYLNVSSAAISLQDNTGQRAIPRQDVRTVNLMKNKHRLRNTLLGAGAGAGIGAVVGASQNDSFFGRGVGAAVGAVVFLVPGAVIGVLVPGHETIYRTSSH